MEVKQGMSEESVEGREDAPKGEPTVTDRVLAFAKQEHYLQTLQLPGPWQVR